MIIRFKNGQAIPGNILRSLRYLSKVGVMSKETWCEFFGKGKARWKRRQLLLLESRGLIRPHTCGRIKDVWVLAESSLNILKKMKLTSVHPIPPQFVEHDEVVANGVLKLENAGICQKWFTERELKMFNLNEYLIQKKDNETKYPDAVFKVDVQGGLKTFAVEYERTGKATTRYRTILWNYSSMKSVAVILYIVENDSIKKRILSALRFVGKPELNQKMAFVDAEAWKENPLTAPIQIKGKVIAFEDFGPRKIS